LEAKALISASSIIPTAPNLAIKPATFSHAAGQSTEVTGSRKSRSTDRWAWNVWLKHGGLSFAKELEAESVEAKSLKRHSDRQFEHQWLSQRLIHF